MQPVHTPEGARDETVRDNELVLIPDGYHPVVAGPARSLAASDDPDYAWVRTACKKQDPPVQVVRG